MTDVHSPEIRSYNMAQIKGKNTKPEEIVRKLLFARGFRYRKNVSALPGTPDIVLPKYKTCIFVNGCFWHRHEGCKYTTTPHTREEFWQKKFQNNIERDELVKNELEKLGWKVIIVWECELRKRVINKTFEKLIREINESLVEE